MVYSKLKCALPSCSKPPYRGSNSCSRTHYLLCLTSSICTSPTCRFPGCFLPAFVESDQTLHQPARVHEFCGWRHCRDFAALTARSSLPILSGEHETWAEPSLDTRIEILKDFVLNKTPPPRSTPLDERLYFKHPWEILRPEDKSCWLIARCRWKPNKATRELITEQGFHWKQQSQPITRDNISTKYRTYERMHKQIDASDEDMMKYTMVEYMIEDAANHVADFKHYCLVKLSREKRTRKRARLNAEDHIKHIAESRSSEQARKHLPQLQDPPFDEQEEVSPPQEEDNVPESNGPVDIPAENIFPQLSETDSSLMTWAANELMGSLKELGFTEEEQNSTEEIQNVVTNYNLFSPYDSEEPFGGLEDGFSVHSCQSSKARQSISTQI